MTPRPERAVGLGPALGLALLGLACNEAAAPLEDAGSADHARSDRASVDRARDRTPGEPAEDRAPSSEASPACPPRMALVDGSFCIDRYEGALEEQVAGTWSPASPYLTVGKRVVRAVVAEGIVPQGYLSGAEAQAACAAAGKRLCSSSEWLAACRGPAGTTYPYGASYVAGACNDAYSGHPVVKYFGTSVGVWDAVHMNDPGINQQPGTVAKGGAFAGCVTPGGVHDLHGNLHEWVADAAGTFRGGFYADAKLNGQGCLYQTTAHAFDYHDYSTGFRCCRDRL